MSEVREQIYNAPYETYQATKKGGLFPFFHALKRFDLDRQRVAYELLDSGQRFLDIGCGFGQLVTMAKSKFDQVYGIDLSSSNIERAKRSIENRVDREKIIFLELDAEKGLPFDNSFFDSVSCIALLEHIFSPPMLLDEIYRVLKRKGRLIVEVPNFAWLPYRIQLVFGKMPVTGGTDELGIDWLHLHNFTEFTLRRFLESKKFRVERVSSSGIFSKYRRWWLSFLSADIIMKALRS